MSDLPKPGTPPELTEAEAAQILQASGDPDLPDDVFTAVEQVLASRLAALAERPTLPECIDDGLGGLWATCGPGCDLQVVRPGKVQCNRRSAACPDAPQSDETVLAIARATSERWREALDLLADAEQAERDSGRLRDEERERILLAYRDGVLSPGEAVLIEVERILADHVRSAESTRARAMNSRAEWRRRARELEQQRDFEAAVGADAVAKLDALATEKQRLSERAASDLLDAEARHAGILAAANSLIPIGTTTTEWGVLQNDGYVSHAPFLTEEMARAAAQHHAPPETVRIVVSRTRIAYPDHVTDWQETS